MKKLKILISNPDTEIIYTARYIWIISALNAIDLKDSILKYGSIGKLIELSEEASIIRLKNKNNIINSLLLFRSITSRYELFYFKNGDDFVISDHFINILRQLEPKDRCVPESTIADHFLFTFVSGHNTYISKIKRCGNGEVLEYLIPLRSKKQYIAEKINIVEKKNDSDPNKRIDYLDRTLGNILDRFLQKNKKFVNMLSGGIDSSLIQTYLGPFVPSVSVGIDSPEFSFEIEYAQKASYLLNTDHKIIMLKENNYIHYLESVIDKLGIPPLELQIILFDNVFKTDYLSYVTGQLADALFGLGLITRTYNCHVESPPHTHIQCQYDVTLISKELSMSPNDPSGYALRRFGVSPDFCFAQKILGGNMTETRIHERLDYVRKRVDFPERKKFWKHLELGSMIDYFHDDAVNLWRQLGYYHRKSLYAPFACKSLVNASLCCGAHDRYINKCGEIKHLLKKILKQRCPAFPICNNIVKGGSGFPRTRYCKDGPLRGFFDRYPIPEFLNMSFHDLIKNPRWDTSRLTFSVISYAIWNERIFKNANIPPVPGTRCLKWDISDCITT